MKLTRIVLPLMLASVLAFSCRNSGTSSGTDADAEASADTLEAETLAVLPGDADEYAMEPSGTAAPAEEPAVPVIKLLSGGSILPSSGNMDLLFSSANYASAQVRIRKIYTSNILQFMQYGSYEARWELSKVSREVADTTLLLGSKDAPHLKNLRTYGISLDELIKPEPGAIYHVEIKGVGALAEGDSDDDYEYSFGDYSTYDERNTFLLASDLVLIAKAADNRIEVFATNILTGAPASGVKIKLYDEVLQEIGKGVSDASGRVTFAADESARYLLAQSGLGCAYLAMKPGLALSTSSFDVSGKEVSDGVKAFIFGERGVWRPGDTLHITAITRFEDKPLPAGHPIVAELLNPDEQVVSTLSVRNDGSNIYHFPFVTDTDAPTGRWTVNLKLGGQSFRKGVRIETVRPNRMDIQLSFDRSVLLTDGSCSGTVDVKWLYGAPGAGLKVNGELELSSARTAFQGYSAYSFTDVTRSYDGESFSYPDMRTDSEGRCLIGTALKLNPLSIPGLLKADFSLRAFEPSGEYSTGGASYIMSPFPAYVGLKTKMDKTVWDEECLIAKRPHKFDIVTLGPDGKPVEVKGLNIEVCHVEWNWWWNSASSKASYMNGKSRECVYEATLDSGSSGASFSYDWADAPNGLYCIRVSDRSGGHAATLLCEVCDGKSQNPEASSDAATKLSLKLDRESYKVGETARLSIPSAAGSRALVSIEKGGRLLDTRWVPCSAGSTIISIPVTAAMQPNAYVFVTLVQPHSNSLNDAPLRLYGISNLSVSNPAQQLSPKIQAPSEVRPQSRMTVKVSEEKGRAMNYMLAIVDEGLLGITGYKTPDPWNAFNAREALKVRTWDEYDDVIGAYGGRIEQLFAVGGDEEAENIVGKNRESRFKPVVACLGPFSLKAGRTASHVVDIPQYIGSLRVMAVATAGDSQGSASVNVNVTQPVMVQAAVPASLKTGETLQLPVTLMALEDGVGEVKIKVKATGALACEGAPERSVKLGKAGQSVEYFTVKASAAAGPATLEVSASSRSDKAVHSVSTEVGYPNPEHTAYAGSLVKPGEKAVLNAGAAGIAGTGKARLEVSTFPSFNLEGRLRYLNNYPYGCLEQTVSTAFANLYVDKVSECSADDLTRIRRIEESAIRRLQNFRNYDGSLTYWPGGDISEFGSAYALFYLCEAASRGYAVPSDLKNSLVSYVSRMVSGKKSDATARAMGLYALVLAGKPQRGVMNHLRENIGEMPEGAAWMLAAAYSADGRKDVALSLASSLKYPESRYSTFGSADRNMAVALRVLQAAGRNEEAFRLASSIASRLNDKSVYMSTQATAWCLYSVCSYASAANGAIDASYVSGKASGKLAGKGKSVLSTDIPVPGDPASCALEIVNNGSSELHALFSVTCIPEAGTEKAVSGKLSMTVRYYTDSGSYVKPDTLSRGRLFKAVVTVTNTSASTVENIALDYRIPSGWQIRNARVRSDSDELPEGIDYQDFRDDRVCSFFKLGAGKSVNVPVKLTAAYPGRFYLPAVSCGAMYDDTMSALVPGGWIEVK